MSDLVQRLEARGPLGYAMSDSALISEAAAHIRGLEGEQTRLRAAIDNLCAYYAERERAGNKEPMQVTNFRKAVS